jgi:hydroxyacylglutathione hydrolase
MYLKQVEVGLMQNFNYLIGDPETHECVYIDPAWEVDRILKIAKEDGYRVKHILLTHNHFDHIEGVQEVVQKTGADVRIHKLDEKPLHTGEAQIISLSSGDEFRMGSLKITALNTPGHTPGSTCYLVQGPDDPIPHLFTGDTLFQGNCGRSDLPGGDPAVLFKSLGELKALDPIIKVYPGHDYGTRTVTTIGYEKQHNPTLRAKTYQEFALIP